MVDDQEVINKIVELIKNASNPRETRKVINKDYPVYDDEGKLKLLIPEIVKKFDKKKRDALKKTQFFKYFLIGEDTIKI